MENIKYPFIINIATHNLKYNFRFENTKGSFIQNKFKINFKHSESQ